MSGSNGGKSKFLIIDMDATADQLYGNQVGGAWNGFYRYKCLLPLLAFVGPNPIYCRTRAGDVDGVIRHRGSVEQDCTILSTTIPRKNFLFFALTVVLTDRS